MIEHLSYSSISNYLLCGMAWKFHYVDKVETSTSSNLIFGSAFHNTVEAFLNGHEKPIHELWSKEWQNQIEGKKIDYGNSTEAELYNLGIRMLTDADVQKGLIDTFLTQEKMPVIEKFVELKIKGIPIPIIGYIDIITADGIPGDFKTSARSWTPDKATEEMQPLFYLAALKQAGKPVESGKFRHYIFVKTKKPQFQVFETVHKELELEWLEFLVKGVWDGISKEVYAPNPNTWKCNPNYCEYWSICRGKYV